MITALPVFTMPHGLGILVAISALLPVGYSLQCTSCVVEGDLSCQGNRVTCPSGYVCASAYKKTTTGGNSDLAIIRSCQLPSKCYLFGSISVSTATIKFWTSCCYTDNCIPKLTPLSPDSSQLNGVTCPACVSSSSTCDSGETMQCTGTETVCAQHTVTVNNGLASHFRGCFSQSLCDVGNFSANIDGTPYTHAFLCPTVNPVNPSSRSCISCHTTSGTSCTGSTVICPTGYVCASVLVIEGNAQNSTFIRSCQPQSVCSKTGSISYLGGQIKMATSCCDSDNCTPIPPTLPSDNTQVNNVACQTCSSSYCGEQTLRCTGNEIMCVIESSYSSDVLQWHQGCATKSVCDISSFYANIGGATFNLAFPCYNPIPVALSSRSCILCHSTSGTFCTGSSVICPTGHVCASALQYVIQGNAQGWTFTRSCQPQSVCSKTGSISYLGGQIKMATSCCDSDNCTPTPPTLLGDNSKKNGLKCPSCSSFNSLTCDASQDLYCTGSETQCVANQRIIINGGMINQEVIVGCSTPAVCEFGGFFVNTSSLKLGMTFECSSANSSASAAFSHGFTCTLVSLIMLIKYAFEKF